MRESKLRLMFITVNIGVKMSGITHVQQLMECKGGGGEEGGGGCVVCVADGFLWWWWC